VQKHRIWRIAALATIGAVAVLADDAASTPELPMPGPNVATVVYSASAQQPSLTPEQDPVEVVAGPASAQQRSLMPEPSQAWAADDSASTPQTPRVLQADEKISPHQVLSKVFFTLLKTDENAVDDAQQFIEMGDKSSETMETVNEYSKKPPDLR
jgi:hypothetical protein